jgi:hypothetical protein
MFSLVRSLKKKYNKAVEEEKNSCLVWEELDLSLDDNSRKQWMEQERLAMKHRGHHLSIYNVDLPAGKSTIICCI